MAYPRGQLSRNFKFVSRNAGDITVNTPINTWQELAAETGGPGTGNFDLIISAQIGDVIACGVNMLVQSTAVDLFLDFKTMVSGSPVNSVVAQGLTATTTPPYGPWYAAASTLSRLAGDILYTVTTSDVPSGLVTFRPYVATATATNRLVYAGANHLLQFSIKNLGPAKPN